MKKISVIALFTMLLGIGCIFQNDRKIDVYKNLQKAMQLYYNAINNNDITQIRFLTPEAVINSEGGPENFDEKYNQLMFNKPEDLYVTSIGWSMKPENKFIRNKNKDTVSVCVLLQRRYADQYDKTYSKCYHTTDYFLGLSADSGKTFLFIPINGKTESQIRQYLPDFNLKKYEITTNEREIEDCNEH